MDSQRRLEQAVDAMLNRIYKKAVNPIRRESYVNMASCFDLSNQQEIDRCLAQSQRPVSRLALHSGQLR